MSVTLATLRARCRLTLASATAWPDATLNAWLGDAIRFYSVEFPRALRHDYALATGTQVYDLPAGCQLLTAVEYPTGEDPAAYLQPAAEWSAAFQAGGDVYALRGMLDSVAATADTAHLALVFAETVLTGQHALVSYLGLQRVPASDAEYTSVPEQHSEALIAFVEFRGHWELESDEAFAVATVSVVLSQLGENARRAWNRYKEIMDRLQALTPAVAPASAAERVVWGRIGL